MKKKQISGKTRRKLEEISARVDSLDRERENPGTPAGSGASEAPARFEKVSPSSDAQPGIGAAPKRGPGRPPKSRPEVPTPETPSGKPSPVGTPSAAVLLPSFVIDEKQCTYLLQMVGNFSTMLCSLATGLPPTESAKIWFFSPFEIDALKAPATRVINKRAPEWLRLYADEFALLIVLLPILTAKMAATIGIRARMRAAAAAPPEEKTPAKTNGSGEIPQEPAA
jgi:hypothetical protein